MGSSFGSFQPSSDLSRLYEMMGLDQSTLQSATKGAGMLGAFGKGLGAMAGGGLTPLLFGAGSALMKMFGSNPGGTERAIGTQELRSFARGKDVYNPNQYQAQFYQMMLPKTSAWSEAIARETGVGQPDAKAFFYQMMQDKLAENQYDLTMTNALEKYRTMFAANQALSQYRG